MGQAETSVAAVPLADATCLALWGLLLRGGGLGPEQAAPKEMLAELRRLSAEDAALASALEAFLQLSSDSAADCRQSVSADTAFNQVARHLPLLLVQYFGQAASTTAVGQANRGSLQAQLLGLCHLILRNRALETGFTAELEKQKTAALYHFAYGLSHELNNPLANIATRAGVLISQESHPQRVRLLEAIVNHAMRGCEMLGDLMLVARPPELSKELTRVDELLQQVLARAQPWAEPFQVRLRGELMSQRSLRVDAAALTEALWAVLRNAIEAMPDGGEIVVHLGEQPADNSATASAVFIEIADQGTGLSPEALHHCFDPYYSGREAGRGLGLGLTKARRIVELHGGQLSLANRPCGGCIARMVLS